MPRNPSATEVTVWCREVATVIGNTERKIVKMKASPRKEVREKGATLSSINPTSIGKQAKRAGLPAEIIQNLLDSVGATPLRDKLVRGDGNEWSKMTREGFATFARTPAEDFKLCMEIMVQLVSWANGGKV